MQIGEVIRKYRKNNNMTQEDIANRLGVTAPAVNKWEKGNSLPDIMLLAPIARLLDISLDTLLSFREDLTDEEVNNLIKEADLRFGNESFEEVFLWAKKKMELYPNCEHLTLWMTHLLNARCSIMMVGGSNSEKYEDYIISCYIRLLDSINEDTRNQAADSLFSFYLRKEQFEKAEEYLSYFSKQNPERKRKQAVIYSKTNRRTEAYKSYEELLFSGYQVMSIVLNSIFTLAMEDKNVEKAYVLAEKQLGLANLLEMGEYGAITSRLELALAEKDVEMTIDAMKKMFASTDEMCAYTKSSLYEHMVFKELTEEFVVRVKENLLAYFRDEETFSYLQSDKRWQDIVNMSITK